LLPFDKGLWSWRIISSGTLKGMLFVVIEKKRLKENCPCPLHLSSVSPLYGLEWQPLN
jgi:hypothetical protein